MKELIRMFPYLLVAFGIVFVFVLVLAHFLPTAEELVPVAETILKGFGQ